METINHFIRSFNVGEKFALALLFISALFGVTLLFMMAVRAIKKSIHCYRQQKADKKKPANRFKQNPAIPEVRDAVLSFGFVIVILVVLIALSAGK